MNRTETVELTTLCLIYDEDMILLQNRVKKDWKGFTLPGGHVEPGESIVEAVIREMKEETGLTIKHPQLCGVKQFPITDNGQVKGRYLVFLFRTNQFEGELVSSEEGKMKWIRRDALTSVPAVNDLDELLQVMEQDDLTEFQYVIEDGKWQSRLF
ncbi:MAG: 8-oxo-dGTP diphosphatase [Acetatifactor sp.]|nr:8-oxo-dGTP diphosphatase [Acetatifactor sp.]